MLKVQVSPQQYLSIITGMKPFIIIDESKEYIVNDQVEVNTEGSEFDTHKFQACICSINYITTSDQEPGLKKNFSILSLSVVRHLL